MYDDFPTYYYQFSLIILSCVFFLPESSRFRLIIFYCKWSYWAVGFRSNKTMCTACLILFLGQVFGSQTFKCYLHICMEIEFLLIRIDHVNPFDQFNIFLVCMWKFLVHSFVELIISTSNSIFLPLTLYGILNKKRCQKRLRHAN